MSCATDDAIYSSPTAAWRIFSSGSAKMLSNPFDTKWRDNYRAINYLNMFLENDRGYNTRYMVAEDSDLALRNCLQGSAYGLRAWMYFDLLRVFGGKAENGELLGVPILKMCIRDRLHIRPRNLFLQLGILLQRADVQNPVDWHYRQIHQLSQSLHYSILRGRSCRACGTS